MEIQKWSNVLVTIVFLIFQGFSSHASGNEDVYDYDDLNYDDEESVYVNPEPDINLRDYKPKITSKSKTIEVDAGTTIRLPCTIAHLPG